jgi:hypothetical protein
MNTESFPSADLEADVLVAAVLRRDQDRSEAAVEVQAWQWVDLDLIEGEDGEQNPSA